MTSANQRMPSAHDVRQRIRSCDAGQEVHDVLRFRAAEPGQDFAHANAAGKDAVRSVNQHRDHLAYGERGKHRV